MKYSAELKLAFKNSIPVMMGYLVLGFGMGILMANIGLEWYWVVLMSLVVYAGALQYAAVGFLSAKLSIPEIAIASFFINIRHSFYGLSLLKKYAKTSFFKPYLIHSLTDETYGVMTGMPTPEDISQKHYALFLSAMHQSYWVLGSLAGVLFGSSVEFDTRGVEFSLTALFVVLLIEQYKTVKNITPFVLASISSVAALMLFGKDMLLPSIVLTIVFLFTLRGRIDG